MLLFRRRVVILTLFFITIISVYLLLTGENNTSRDLNFTGNKVKISSLPDDVYHSLSLLEQQVTSKYKNNNNSNYFTFDVFKIGTRKIKSGETLILSTYYKKSKKTVQNITSMPESFVGLTPTQLESVSGVWEVKKYIPERGLILYREVNDLAPEDRNKVFIGIKGNKVAIFYGTPESRVLKQKTDINVEDLPQKDKIALKQGITVNSQEELLSILEGLKSINSRD
ncbi:BofC C-terminal domain-containing protein [Halothermothrix orenii]|uniref:Bypass of forespore C C-terminal domain-containing protein n=1 Tax=Halothermothrix orenii (strain H 168 / OCM 544 / DSM 9562) TaxID=373903 RepID=B8CXG5_HALOH|nr:BofC C-terminal domain-containing protein [Halothermothrix orenii]ACL69984.1 hypothetical protein Hore_12340 [Halothermothrix orenii H 168]